MKPLPRLDNNDDMYKNATYEELIPRHTYKPPTKTDPYVLVINVVKYV
jgi:hypothetical protein